MGLTPTQIYNQVRAQAGESSDSFLTEAVLYSFIWQAEIELANFVGCSLDKDTSITTVASTRESTIPTGTLQILRVLYDSVKLKKIDLTELDMVEGTAYGGVTTSGQPQYYYEFGTAIGLSPIPSEAKTLTIYRVKEPAELDASSTIFTIPADYSHYLADKCLYLFYAMDKELQQAEYHLKLWERNKIQAKNEWFKKKMMDRYLSVKDEDKFQQTDYGII